MVRFILLGALLPLLVGCGMGGGSRNYCAAVDPELAIQDVRAELASVRYRQEDAQSEIGILEERLEEQQLLSQTNLELLHAQLTGLQRKVQELEGQQFAALTDIRELGRYAKESASALTEVQSKQSDLRKGYLADISNIKGAMESLASIQESPTTPSSKGQTYKVVSGDTLEKIARKFNTTVGAIKEENKLENDRIYSGQLLRIP